MIVLQNNYISPTDKNTVKQFVITSISNIDTSQIVSIANESSNGVVDMKIVVSDKPLSPEEDTAIIPITYNNKFYNILVTPQKPIN